MALTKIPRGLLDTGIADSSDATAITIDSSENVTFAGNILKTGDLTLDVSGTLVLDSDDGDVQLKDGGTQFASLYKSSNDFIVRSMIADGDFKIQGNDGGSTINALTFDMSAAGAATFNSGVTLSGDLSISYQGGNITWGTNYPAIGNIKSSQATLLGNNIKAGSANNTIVRHAHGSDAGNFIALTYNKGVTFHTGITTTQNSDAAETTNERMRIDTTGNVGIGINPSNTFSVGASGTVTTRYTSTDTNAFSLLMFENSGSIVFSADHGNSAASSDIVFKSDGAQERVRIDSVGTLKVGAVVPTPGSGWDANLDAIQVGEASAFRSGDSDYSAATYVSTNLYQTGGGDKLLNGTDFAAQYVQQGGNHYFYGYENGSANATPAPASNDLANPLLIYKGGGLQISQGSVSNTANGKAGIFWGGAPQDGADYCIRRTNDAWSASNYAQLLIDWDTGVKIDVGNNAYGKSFLEVNGPITTFSDFAPHDYADLSDWSTRGISVNLHPSLEASGNAIDHCDNARNMGIRVLVHQSTTSSTNRPTGYGTIWCDQHYYSNLSGSKGAKYVMQKCVGHSSTPLEYRRNTDTSNGTAWSSWYTVDHTITSDVRAKKNIVDAPTQLENLKKIKVRKFDFINDLDPNAQLGMIAQELDTTLPEYVWKQKDRDTGEVLEDLMWRIRYKDMIPMLIKSIQELSAEVEALKSK